MRPFLGGRYRTTKAASPEEQPLSVEARTAVFDHQIRVHEQNIRAAEREHDYANETKLKLIEASTRDATEAMKVVLAINGGAGIGILTFLGTSSRDVEIMRKALAYALWGLGFFSLGVILAVATAALAYFANSYYSAYYRAQKHRLSTRMSVTQRIPRSTGDTDRNVIGQLCGVP